MKEMNDGAFFKEPIPLGKRLRGMVKLFFPYFIQAAYIRRRYGVDVTPKWYNRESFASRLRFAAIQLLPYGLIGPNSVIVPPPIVHLPMNTMNTSKSDTDTDPANVKAASSANNEKAGAKPFSISPSPFEIFNENSMSAELIADIHARVCHGLYPEMEGDAHEGESRDDEPHENESRENESHEVTR